jgi:hypothetical protein
MDNKSSPGTVLDCADRFNAFASAPLIKGSDALGKGGSIQHANAADMKLWQSGNRRHSCA